MILPSIVGVIMRGNKKNYYIQEECNQISDVVDGLGIEDKQRINKIIQILKGIEGLMGILGKLTVLKTSEKFLNIERRRFGIFKKKQINIRK